MAASHQPRPVFAGSNLSRSNSWRARSSMLLTPPPVTSAFNERLHNERCDREQHKQRCDRECAHKVVLIVENLDMQRHRVREAPDMARDDGDCAELTHGARIAEDDAVQQPPARWGLLYGIILCNARAMGEFGAVSVVSGHIRGLTNTMPLHIEILYNEYNFVGAFAVASLLMLLAVATLIVKTLVERTGYRRR